MDTQKEQVPHGYVSLREYIDTRFRSVEAAVDKAEAATERRFESVNEMRGMLNDHAARAMPRSEYEASSKPLVEKIEGLQKLIWMGLGLVLALQFLGSMFLVFWKKQ